MRFPPGQGTAGQTGAQPDQGAEHPERDASGEAQQLFRRRLAEVRAEDGAEGAGGPHHKAETPSDIAFPEVGHGPRKRDEEHCRNGRADRGMHRQVEKRRQDGHGDACAARADKSDEQPDEKGDCRQRGDDLQVMRLRRHRVTGSRTTP